MSGSNLPSYSSTKVTAVAGQNQVGQVDSFLASPLTALVTNTSGQALSGVTVEWRFAGGRGSAKANGTTSRQFTAVTDDSGQTTAYWQLDTVAGAQQATLSLETTTGSGKKAKTLTFNSNAKAAHPSKLTITPNTVTLQPGSSTDLSATVLDKWGNVVKDATVSWSSSNDSVAAVDSIGLVSAAAQGTAMVTATAQSASGTASVSVQSGSTTPDTTESTVTPVWQDGFETGNKSYTENGYRWTSSSSTGVSTDRAYSGKYSLKFTFGPNAPLKDAWSEQRFQLGSYLSAVWIEYELYVPTNFYHREEGSLTGVGGKGTFTITSGSWTPALATNYLAGAAVTLKDGSNSTVWSGTVTSNSPTTLYFTGDATGATRLAGSASNNKFFLIWKDDYQQLSDWKAGFEYEPSSITPGDSKLRPYSTTYTKHYVADINNAQVNLSDPFISNGGPGLVRGRWNQVRIELKAATGIGKDDGVLKLWINGRLFFAKTNGDFWNALGLPTTTLHNGYILGWSNSGFTERTLMYVDNVKVYDTDPGWK